MALDAATLALTAGELKQTLTDAKIAKIFEPTRDELVLTLRTRTETYALLLSARSGSARVCLTEESFENPETPPSFCMLMRKHLTGGRLLDVQMEPGDRIVYFTFQCTNEMGDLVQNILCAELMGRYSNLVLVQNGKIIDALKRVDFEDSDVRQLLPGLPYTIPPKPARPDFLQVSAASIVAAACERDLPVADALNKTVAGVGPVVCREAAWRAFDGEHLLANELDDAQKRKLMAAIDELKELHHNGGCPCSVTAPEGKPVEFTVLPILQYGPETESRTQESFSRMLDEFYERREAADRVRQRGQDLVKAVTSARDRTARKLANQTRELEATRDRERLRELGDILTSNLHAMERGMEVLRVVDFYDPEGREVEIRLDPLLAPQQNAAKYYKDYNKAKTAEQMLTIQLEKGARELEYLNSVLENLSLAEGERDLQEIRQELVETGYLRRRAKAKDRMKRPGAKPLEFRSTAGLRISVGRNNLQNDRLTTKQAGKWDYWFHTQKIHGAHVILWTEGRQPDDQSLREAAALAAWFSQGREGKKVPVDYTPVKYVKKPAGARPGMVVYTTYQTAYVDPDPALADTLRA